MESGPYAVVISCSDSHPREIVKLIVTEDEFANSTTLHSNITAYPWHIETKYYTTDVHVCAVEDNTCDSNAFTSSIEAVILQFDSNKNEGLGIATSWFPFIEEVNPEIRILVCDRCLENPTSGISKLAAQEWCIARGFELVELNPELDEEWEEEQDFKETTGVARIVQALHAHMWPNLSLKGQPRSGPPGLQSLLVNGANVTPAVDHPTNGHDQNGHDQNGHDHNTLDGAGQNGHIIELAENIARSEGGSGQGEENMEDFFELFQNLALLKQHVSNMPSEDRKVCAEHFVKAFWTAMGGDSSELSDLDSSD